jgi:membrane associated rhomboid family serine protease
MHRATLARYDRGVIIPIGHDQTIKRWPWVTIAIIATCTLVQIYASFVAPTLTDVLHAATAERAEALAHKIPIWRFGYITGSGFGFDLFASTFVHAGWTHLIGNMLFLWLAAAPLEDRWGPVKFGAFYLVGAAAATLCFEAMYSGSGTILVGASGAVSAVMGAFLVLFAKTQITFWYFWLRATGTFEMAAYFALPLWLGEQLVWAGVEQKTGATGVAYSAHIGGFATGLAIAAVARVVFKNSAPAESSGDDDDNAATAAAPEPRRAIPAGGATERDRYDRCMTAIRLRDLGTVRTLASRVILDQARVGDHRSIVELYDALGALRGTALTDGAFVAAANAADALGRADKRDAIIAELKQTHPGSSLARER